MGRTLTHARFSSSYSKPFCTGCLYTHMGSCSGTVVMAAACQGEQKVAAPLHWLWQRASSSCCDGPLVGAQR